ncbi:MAG: glycosyltransferase family 4 protein [Deltaproteobacteria bacterium]|nr:glycosyltransferase family 4 protein [Deltaproteobacteria bacterium]
MRTLGFINSFDELAGADRRLGRKVASFDLASALMEHASADEIIFFLPFAGALKHFQRGYAPWLEQSALKKRVKVMPATQIGQIVAGREFWALHAGELERYFPELCHLRNRLPAPLFPVTCLPHTLSYWSTQVRNLYKVLPGPQPYDSIFCTSRAARDHLEKALGAAGDRLGGLGLNPAGYGGRLDVVPLGVRAADFARADPVEARRRLEISPETVVLLCLGRLTPHDKYDLMPLLAAVSLLGRRQQIMLLIAGAGEEYVPQLREAAESLGLSANLRLAVDFDTPLKPWLYAAADIFVSPADNLQETFGLTLLEAMAAGLPVVASDFSGYRDIVIPGETGFLIPTLGPQNYQIFEPAWHLAGERAAATLLAQHTALDLDLLVRALEALTANPDLCRRMGRAGRARVAQEFDWPVVVRRMEAVWDDLAALARQSPPPPPLPDVLGAGLGELFSHFPSGVLKPDDVIITGPMAGRFARRAWGQRLLPDLAGFCNLAALEGLLMALRARGGSLSLGELAQHLGRRLPPQTVEHLVLHGLKYGILSLANSPKPPPEDT